jgi:hypothetical protein
MAIYPQAADLADRLATDTQPASAVKRNADGTIDYFERMILEPHPAASPASTVTPATRVATAEEPAASGPSSAYVQAGGLPPRRANLVLAGLQLLVGYAWLVSGVDKLLYGSFPDRVPQLISSSIDSGRLPDIFAQLAQAIVLPNAFLLGVLVECGETLTGAGLLAGAVIALVGPALERRIIARQASGAAQPRYAFILQLLGVLTMGAALGGAFLGLNFYVMDGMPTPWFTPGIAYGGAIHSGLLLSIACLIILVGQIGSRIRRPAHPRISPSAAMSVAG